MAVFPMDTPNGVYFIHVRGFRAGCDVVCFWIDGCEFDTYQLYLKGSFGHGVLVTDATV